MNDEERKLFERAVQHWGPTAQMMMVVEEMAELTVALCHDWRDRVMPNDPCEEMADVSIMLDQLILIYRAEDRVAAHRAAKLRRLRGLLDEEDGLDVGDAA